MMKSRKPSSPELLQLTSRDLAMFQKINAAGWLTTRQILNYFFAKKSANAVCKRLRKLVAANYLAATRLSSTEHNFYRLAGQGKLALIEHKGMAAAEISIPTQLPRKLRHYTAINDLRFAFEHTLTTAHAEVQLFLSERELARSYRQPEVNVIAPLLDLLQAYGLIPDAIARLCVNQDGTSREINIAVEYDGGTEHANFFGRTKMKPYAELFARHRERIGDFKVLTVADRVKRLVSLMRQATYHQTPAHLFYFVAREKLARSGWADTKLFLDPHDFFQAVRQGEKVEVVEKELNGGAIPRHALIHLPPASPFGPSCRGEIPSEITSYQSGSYCSNGGAVI